MKAPLLSLLLLLPAASPAAASPADEEKLLQDTLAVLIERAPYMKEESHLDTAKDFAGDIPFSGPVSLFYKVVPRVTAECPAAIAEGCSVFASRYCLVQEEGVIVSGTDAWSILSRDGRPDADRVAFGIAHELGHIRLRHTEQTFAFRNALMAKWYPVRGKPIRDTWLKKELTRYKKPLSQDDKDVINADMLAAVKEVFAYQMDSELQAFGRKKESEADEYAYKLCELAGYAPEKMAGAFLEDALSAQLAPAKLSKECQAYDAKSQSGGGDHPGDAVRDRAIFERFILGGSLER